MSQAPLASVDLNSYLPVLILITMAVLFGIGNVVASLMLGPRRDGKVKGMTYESGMNAIGNARKRFNIRFYIIAMVFLVFDIEIIFLYPWAVTFPSLDQALGHGGCGSRGFYFLSSRRWWRTCMGIARAYSSSIDASHTFPGFGGR